MREIKFRGMASSHLYNGADLLHKKGDWLYGDLIHQDGKMFIAPGDVRYPKGTNFTSFVVDSETVGQFTGLKDVHGVRIYEGDIIERVVPACWYADGAMEAFEDKLQVEWDEEYVAFYPFTEFNPLFDIPETHREVIGNIHDNPELLKEGARQND